MTQPSELVFETMKCPQSDSFCPCEGIRGHDLLLWQDFRYNPGHPKEKEQGLRLDIGTWNRLLEGLPTPIGVPKTDGARMDFVYDEDAPLIATGPFIPTGYKDGVPDDKETEQITCRMKFFHFTRPAPQGLNRNFKPCALCWSRWVLEGEIEWRRANNQALEGFLAKVAAKLGGPLVPVVPAPCSSAPTIAPVPPATTTQDAEDEEALDAMHELELANRCPAVVPDIPWVPGLNCPALDERAGTEMQTELPLPLVSSSGISETQQEWEDAAMVAADLIGNVAAPSKLIGQQGQVLSQSFHDHLLSIVALHKDGYLTASQFEQAKIQIGL